MPEPAPAAAPPADARRDRRARARRPARRRLRRRRAHRVAVRARRPPVPAAPACPPSTCRSPTRDTATSQVLLRSADGDVRRLRVDRPAPGRAVDLHGGPARHRRVGHRAGVRGHQRALRRHRRRERGRRRPARRRACRSPSTGSSTAPSTAWSRSRRIAWATHAQHRPGGPRAGGDARRAARRSACAGWRPGASRRAATARACDVVMVGVPVGAPVVDIPEAERFLRLGTCSLDGDPVVLNERQWLWPLPLRNDCPEVLPGQLRLRGAGPRRRAAWSASSTRPRTRASRAPSAGSGGRARSTRTARSRCPTPRTRSRSAGLDRCFGADGTFALGGRVPAGPRDRRDVPRRRAARGQPGGGGPVTAHPRRPTWATTVATDGARDVPLQDRTARHHRLRGRRPATPRARAGGDADRRSPARPTEQRLLLCVVAAARRRPTRRSPSRTSTPRRRSPTSRSRVTGGRAGGWRIEPVFDPPELSMFMVKVGPARADRLRRPGRVRGVPAAARSACPGADAPARFCAIGYDDAEQRVRARVPGPALGHALRVTAPRFRSGGRCLRPRSGRTTSR